MPANPKLFISGKLYEITFRAEEGLPLVATPYIRVVLEGILGRAQYLYPVTLCQVVVMRNHMHLMMVVSDPEAATNFVQYIKRESAHAVNRFLGRRKRTLWGSRYDSPIILDFEKAIERIVYFYSNPLRALAVRRIEEYPNISTWKQFQSGTEELSVEHIPRDSIPKLPDGALSLSQQQRLADTLQAQSHGRYKLKIEPFAWLECFEEGRKYSIEEVREMVTSRVQKIEEELVATGNTVTGAHQLRLQRMDEAYIPKQFGKKMVCLSSSKNLRILFLDWYLHEKAKAKNAYLKWKEKGEAIRPPPGFFLPGGRLVSNLLPIMFAGIL